MIILGIDPGVALTGWGVIRKKDKPELVGCGYIKTPKEKSQEQRLLMIYNQLHKIIKQFKPEIVCLEKLFFNKNVKTALAVGEARGVVKLCGLINRLKIAEFTPLQIKQCITGFGRAEKRQVQEMVKVLIGLEEVPKPDDVADALAVALTYCVYNKNLEGLK